MCVTGDWEGTFCADLNDFQYSCSGVMGEGPLGSFTCWSFVIGAAIVLRTLREVRGIGEESKAAVAHKAREKCLWRTFCLVILPAV